MSGTMSWADVRRSAPAAAALLLSAVVVLALAAQPRGPEPLPGALGRPWPSVAIVLLAACLAPGYALWRLLGGRGDALEAAAFSMGLGLALLLAGASLVLAAGLDLRSLTFGLAAANLLLALAAPLAGRRAAARRPRVRPLPALAAGAGLATLVAAVLRRPGFTLLGDEWFHLRHMRYFLEATAFDSTMTFDAWGVVVAALVRLAGVDLVEAYSIRLVPFLMTAAALSYLTLARALFHRWSAAALCFVLQVVYCFADVQTTGAAIARPVEDRFMSLLVAAPLAQAAFVKAVRAPGPRPIALFVILLGTALVLHPMALIWVGLPAAGVLAARVAVRRRPPLRFWIACGGIALAVGAAAWGMRQLRPSAYFQLHAPDWPFNARLLEINRERLWILSLEKGWFMAHGALLLHPLLVASLLCSLALAGRLRRSLTAQFLLSGMLLPVALAYNPLTATWLGAWITPWMLYRLLWAMPVTLVLGGLLHFRLRAWTRGLRGGWATWAHAAAAALCIALIAAPLRPRIRMSLAKLDQGLRVSDLERQLLNFVARQPRLQGGLLAPDGVSIRLPAWTSRVHVLPGPGVLRSPVEHAEILEACRRLLGAGRLHDGHLALMERWSIRYVVAESGSAADEALAAHGTFDALFRNDAFSFYARRERAVPAGSGGVSSPADVPGPPGAARASPGG